MSVPTRGSIGFCATGKSGLGHLRRITNIATALAALAPDVRSHLYTNAPAAGLDAHEIDLFESIDIVPREEMTSMISGRSHGLVVIDTAVIPGIEQIDSSLCLVLRETVPQLLHKFRLADDRLWDLVCLPNPPLDWSPEPTLIGAKRLEPVGWIFRRPPSGDRRKPHPSGSDTPNILVSSGGGGTSETAKILIEQIDGLLREFRRHADLDVRIAQAIGPRAGKESILTAVDETLDVGARLNEYFAGADLVISTVGYNSLLELACVDTPVLLVPISRTYDDQEARARRWAERIGALHDPGNIMSSVTWMDNVLRERHRREPIELGELGAANCARLLLETVG